jgi:GAF domain-containing protein
MPRQNPPNDLETIAHAFESGVGEDLLRSLVATLAAALDADCVFIGQLAGATGGHVETLAFFDHGKIGENRTYELEHTPCANVITGGACIYPSGVQKTFPLDAGLRKMNVHAYFGAPLADSLGRVLGLMAALRARPLKDVGRARCLLKIFGGRAAMELERMRLDRHFLQDVVSRL